MILLLIGLGMLAVMVIYLYILSAYLDYLDDELFSLELEVGMGYPDQGDWSERLSKVQKGYTKLGKYPGMGIVFALKGE